VQGAEVAHVNCRPTITWRLLLAFFVIPLLVPVLLAMGTRHGDGSRSGLNDYLSSLLLVGPVTFAAMVVLGLPLLFVFLRFDLTSLVAFGLGGGVCAVMTGAIMGGPPHMETLVYYGFHGVIAGVVFRLILFGVRPRS
jgi:hypothetical protein